MSSSVGPMSLALAIVPADPPAPVLIERVPTIRWCLSEFLTDKDGLFLDDSLLTHRLLDLPTHTDRELVAELVSPTVSLLATDSTVSVP